MSTIIHCKNCNANIELPDGYAKPFIKCTTCQKMSGVSVPARPGGRTASLPPASAPPSRAPTAPPPIPRPSLNAPVQPISQSTSVSGEEALPEIMKANKRIAGKNCPGCQKAIQLGESVHNCPSCNQASHQNCWNRNHGCGNPSCSGSASEAPITVRGPSNIRLDKMATEEEGSAADMVPCRWCREPIIRGARKCKHCGEFQRDEDRSSAASLANGPVDETDDWGKITLGSILCIVTYPFLIGSLFVLGYALVVLGVMLRVGCGTAIFAIVPFYPQYFVWTNRHTLFENSNYAKVWAVVTGVVAPILFFLIFTMAILSGGR